MRFNRIWFFVMLAALLAHVGSSRAVNVPQPRPTSSPQTTVLPTLPPLPTITPKPTSPPTGACGAGCRTSEVKRDTTRQAASCARASNENTCVSTRVTIRNECVCRCVSGGGACKLPVVGNLQSGVRCAWKGNRCEIPATILSADICGRSGPLDPCR